MEFHKRFFENSTSSKGKAFDLQINDTIKQSSHSIGETIQKTYRTQNTFSNKLISLVFKNEEKIRHAPKGNTGIVKKHTKRYSVLLVISSGKYKFKSKYNTL